MGMILRLGCDTYLGREYAGRLRAFRVVEKSSEIVEVFVDIAHSGTSAFAFNRVRDATRERISLVSGACGRQLGTPDEDLDSSTLSKRTKIFAVDGWVSQLAGLEADPITGSAERFLLDMGHPITRLIGVERWFVLQIQPEEIFLKLSTQDLAEYPSLFASP